MPDKAIDLIDEAGAAKESEKISTPPAPSNLRGGGSEKFATAIVTKADIADVLAKTCKVDVLAMAEEDVISKGQHQPFSHQPSAFSPLNA